MPDQAAGPYAVTDVVDGDTLWIDRGQDGTKVRLIGIDTPEVYGEVECHGPEASAAAKKMLAGESVYIATDPSQGTTDQYGRTLAYVWMADTQTFVNLKLIADGHGYEYTYDDPYRYQDAFQAAEAEAQQDDIGLWATC